MKSIVLTAITLLGIVLIAWSCKKDQSTPGEQMVERTIQYILYTNEDFSDDEHNITFSVFARDNDSTLLDSAIATMKVKEIPSDENKIIIEKKILTDASTDLVAGFVYEIENVGVSWYLDSIPAGQNNKTIEFAFK
jgi:hypothetical protein